MLIHLLIPTAALIIAGFDRKLVLLLCPLAVIPDFDVIFGAHRSISHSLFVLGAISFFLLFYTFHFKPQWKIPAIIVSVFILSNPLMDLFTGPTQLLWPIDSYYYLLIQAPTLTLSPLSLDFSSFIIKFLILTPQEVGGLPVEPFYIFKNEGLISLIIIGLAVLYWIFKVRKSEKSPLSENSVRGNSP